MPSSSTGIERSVSPSPRSRSIPQDPTSSRYRPSTTTTAQYNTPELGNVMHSLHHRPSPHHNPYNPVVAANGYATSSSDPRRAGSGEATLSNTLTNLYRSAVSSFAPSSSSSSSSSSQYQPFTNLEPSPSSLSPRIASTTTTGTARRKRGGGEPASSSLRLTVPAPSTVGFVALCCLWYLSSALSSNTGKSILTRFRYPVTLTFVQFAFVAWYSLVVLVVRARIAHWRITTTNNSPSTTKGGQRRRSSFGQAAATAINNTLRGWGVRKPTRSMFHGTFTMSLFQIAGHVFSSMAIARVPVSTVHTIKALSPLFTVLSYVALFGVRYSTRTYLSLFPLTVGVMLACSFDLRANAIGFLCALGSTFIFVAQNIFSKKLLPKESSAATSGGGGGGGGETLSTSNSKGTSGGGGGGGGHGAKLDKMNLLFYSSGMAFFLMIPIWLYSDATSLFWSPATSQQQQVVDPTNTTASLVFYFFLNGTVHFGQNLLAFSLLARTSPVTYSIASLVKRIAVICIAIVWFGQPVKLVQGFGMTMTFAGLYLYNQSKASVDKGEQRRVMVEKKRGLELPTSLDDARAMDSVESSSAEDDDSNGKLETTTNGGVYNYGHHQQHVPPPPMSSSSMTNAYHPAGPPPLPPPPPRISFEQKHQPPASASVVTSTTNNVSPEQRGQLSRNRQTSLPTTTTLPPPASSKPSSSSPSSHTTLYSPPPPPLNHDSHSSKFVAPPPPPHPPPSSSSSASAAISISAPPTHQSPRYHPDSHLFSQAPPPQPLPLSTSSTTPIANGYR
ncbi:hypothetical protein JCM3766R1_006559 [Sporobolomyces carnicolor]